MRLQGGPRPPAPSRCPHPTCSRCACPSSTESETLGLAPLGATWGRDGREGSLAFTLVPCPSRRFTQAMRNQPRMDSLDTPAAYQAGLVLLGAGSVLVLSSFSALGFTGTFLGKTPQGPGEAPGWGTFPFRSHPAAWLRGQAGRWPAELDREPGWSARGGPPCLLPAALGTPGRKAS